MSHINICRVYIVAFLIYNLQGVIMPAGSIISRSFLLLIFAISVYYTVVMMFKRSIPFFKTYNMFVLMVLIYGIFYILLGKDTLWEGTYIQKYTYLTNTYISMLQIYPLYFFFEKGLLDMEKIKKWIFVFLIVSLIQYYHMENMAMISAIEEGWTLDDITNNAGYIFCSLMPLLFFYKEKPIIQYILLMVIVVFTVSSMKRGAILIVGVSSVWFLFQSPSTMTSKNKIFVFVLAVALIIGAFFYIENMYQSNLYFARRVENTLSGDSSGRDDIYTKAIQYLSNRESFTTQIFGDGPNSTYGILGNRAHNDWLELGINNGLIGVIVYLLYWIRLLTICVKNKKDKLVYAILSMYVIIYLLMSFFSMSYDAMQIYSTIALAWCIYTSYNKPITCQQFQS